MDKIIESRFGSPSGMQVVQSDETLTNYVDVHEFIKRFKHLLPSPADPFWIFGVVGNMMQIAFNTVRIVADAIILLLHSDTNDDEDAEDDT